MRLAVTERTGLPASEERSEALAAWAWCEAVAGSVEEAERLLEQLSAESHASDDWRINDVSHARAMILMRDSGFTVACQPG